MVLFTFAIYCRFNLMREISVIHVFTNQKSDDDSTISFHFVLATSFGDEAVRGKFDFLYVFPPLDYQLDQLCVHEKGPPILYFFLKLYHMWAKKNVDVYILSWQNEKMTSDFGHSSLVFSLPNRDMW